MSARDVAFTLMALGHVAGCRGKSDTEILAEAVGDIVRLEAEVATLERHWIEDDRDLNELIAKCEKYEKALEEIQALYPDTNPPAVILARGIARTALEYKEAK